MEQIYLKTREEWRSWLSRNHDRSAGVWLIAYRKGTGKPTLEYESALEEAICYGWIDSLVRKLDETRFMRKFTPRRSGSRWSWSNRERAERLIELGRMAPPGLEKVTDAKESGLWDLTGRPEIPPGIPPELERVLEDNSRAREFFDSLAPSYRKDYIGWIASAKRSETRKRRAAEAEAMLEQGRKPGLK